MGEVLSINDAAFIDTFDLSERTVGIVGHGYVGGACHALFQGLCTTVVNDKNKTGDLYSSLEDVVRASDVIFVAVPTPMKPTGECHTAFIEAVLQDIQNVAVKIGRELDEFIVVLKSTVPPGFTQRMQERHALRIVFSPEFLTEAASVDDFKRTNRVILGGEMEDARVVYKFFAGVWPDRLYDTYVDHPDGPVVIIRCSATCAEMVKLSTNAHLMARVLLSNELALVCTAVGADYDEVRKLTSLDRRIGTSHMLVPGPDGHPGAGGHCFPKDINNLRFVCSKLGIEERMFTAVHERNRELRQVKDWELMKDRAVIDE